MIRVPWSRLAVLLTLGATLLLASCCAFCDKKCPDCPPATDIDDETIACAMPFSVGGPHYRYVLTPLTGSPNKYVLKCGPEGGETDATQIDVRRGSVLRFVNQLGKEVQVRVKVRPGTRLFGVRDQWIHIAQDGQVDLVVQPYANETVGNPYEFTVQGYDHALEDYTTVDAKDPDPTVKVKGGP